MISQFSSGVTLFLVRWLLFPALSLSFTPLLFVTALGEPPVSVRGFGPEVVSDHPSDPFTHPLPFQQAAASSHVTYSVYDAAVGVTRPGMSALLKLSLPPLVVTMWAYVHRGCLAPVLLYLFQGRSDRLVRLKLIGLFTSHWTLVVFWFAFLRPGDTYLSDLPEFPGHSPLGVGLLMLSVLPGCVLWWEFVREEIQNFVTPIVWLPSLDGLLGFSLYAAWGTDKDCMFCTLI